ncbi:hypothetical protein AX774_g3476 [Zancudomyces culisetae]|uniref:Uncharacterized protein n=1 Tax=Zancudomyces culisetae TaxID=1213189 RepID=A0A1R1PQ38_ZANCU|nr:hypothetical protein AX774_g3476 [Zancudomyces culisetae]|eukprot:OMH83023.1 hypothetical protein AX774_g3476 [Zancudomyces culisetae]
MPYRNTGQSSGCDARSSILSSSGTNPFSALPAWDCHFSGIGSIDFLRSISGVPPYHQIHTPLLTVRIPMPEADSL